MAKAILEVRNLWVGEGANAAVAGVSFSLGRGEVLGIAGGPGAGKSRLLRCIGLDYPPTNGTVWLRGEQVTGATADRRRQLRARRIELVHPPAPEGEPDATVDRGVQGGLLPVRRLTTVPVAGMRQRIQVAKALTNGTEVLLLDEPLAGLDEPVVARIRELLCRLRHEVGTAVVLASRDGRLCAELADEVLVLDRGQVVGRTEGEGRLGAGPDALRSA